MLWAETLASGDQFGFRFNYGTLEACCDIECMIVKKEEDSIPNWKIVCWGAAKTHPKDCYDPLFGRKLAFARAVKPLPVDVRTSLWKAFVATCKLPRFNKPRPRKRAAR